jgi:hypothetical protein
MFGLAGGVAAFTRNGATNDARTRNQRDDVIVEVLLRSSGFSTAGVE